MRRIEHIRRPLPSVGGCGPGKLCGALHRPRPNRREDSASRSFREIFAFGRRRTNRPLPKLRSPPSFQRNCKYPTIGFPSCALGFWDVNWYSDYKTWWISVGINTLLVRGTSLKGIQPVFGLKIAGTGPGWKKAPKHCLVGLYKT